jgi:nitrite reductase/ring-hydroxylating ferredoxin subunit
MAGAHGIYQNALSAVDNAKPRGKHMKTKVADLGSLAEGKNLCVKAEGVNIVLIKMNGAVYAVENRCPHLGLPLGRGKIEDGAIVCPFHGSRFDICTGENTDWVSAVAGMKIPEWSRGLLAFGKKPQPIRTFPVSIEGQNIFVAL